LTNDFNCFKIFKSQGVVAPFFAKEYKLIMRCGEEMLFSCRDVLFLNKADLSDEVLAKAADTI